METLLAVLDDLWQFAAQSLFGFRVATPLDREREVQTSLPLMPVSSPPSPAPATASTLAPANTTAPAITPEDDTFIRSGQQYFVGESETHLYSDPVIAFDTAFQKISYGQSVLVKKLGGRWAEVLIGEQSGWMLKDTLRERREDIHPQLRFGETYLSDSADTIKLRACIGDEFGGGRAGIPLTPAEYVSYKLSQQKRTIDWPANGPRVPGSWQKRLRGQMGIHIAINPATGSVMEYVVDDIGYLAYVEAVFPDQSIKVLQVGVPDDGVYSERTMIKEEYRELRPVFIEVS